MQKGVKPHVPNEVAGGFVLQPLFHDKESVLSI